MKRLDPIPIVVLWALFYFCCLASSDPNKFPLLQEHFNPEKRGFFSLVRTFLALPLATAGGSIPQAFITAVLLLITFFRPSVPATED